MAGRFFWQPPAHQDPAPEQKWADLTYKVLRDALGFLAGIRAEVRYLRRELQQHREEVKMSFEELSKNVKALIEEATRDIKEAVQRAVDASAGASNEQDINDLNTQVIAATDALKSAFANLPTTPPPVTAPATPPVTPAPTVDPVTGAPVDPNAPAG